MEGSGNQDLIRYKTISFFFRCISERRIEQDRQVLPLVKEWGGGDGKGVIRLQKGHESGRLASYKLSHLGTTLCGCKWLTIMG